MKSCFFIGHRDAPEGVYPRLLAAVERNITEYGVTVFYVGHYGALDRMAARAVIELKAKYPGVKLYLLLPYHPAERPIEPPEGFDGSFYPFEKSPPRRYAIPEANKFILKICDCLITYSRGQIGSTRDIAEAAKKQNLRVENLAQTVS